MNTKERNQFVVHSLFRKAGTHTKSNKAMRKAQKQELKRQITE
jgi:hypothetical protein